ncbi:hypothetical protein GCM10028810_44390 [Spirosoma litoris]
MYIVDQRLTSYYLEYLNGTNLLDLSSGQKTIFDLLEVNFSVNKWLIPEFHTTIGGWGSPIVTIVSLSKSKCLVNS